MTAIRTERLTRSFCKILALNQLNLDVPEGAIYALVGPNGAGKTTLIKLLMNIIRPTTGTAQIMGIDSRKLSGSRFENIGYVSENQQMLDDMTVGELLAYLRGFYPTWDRDLEQQLIRRFELPPGQKLKHLSRGMRMKAAFVSSLAYRPKLLVLDEPFSGLDPLVCDELVETLIESVPETTVFLSSHDLAEIENVASHIGFLRGGELLCSEEVEHLTGRFREVKITLSTSEPLPKELPKSWLHVQAEDRAVSFFHSSYREDQSQSEAMALFHSAREFEFAPMTLRSIFLAVAKSAHGGKAGADTFHDSKENSA